MATITAELDEGMAVTLESDAGHRWQADEPEEAGGSGTGPDPYELLLGSLAACTCITVKMYAREKGWALEAVSARYRHDRVHADDCDECDDDQSGYIDRVTGDLTITGDLDDQQQRRLAEVAGRCPVQKTLEKGVHVVDDVSFG